MTLFVFIIISVKFQLKLMSAKFFLPIISWNELSITLSILWYNLTITFEGYWQCCLLMTPINRLTYFSSDVIYMVIKIKIFVKCHAKNFCSTVETFVRIESRILLSISFSWLEIIIYEVLLSFRDCLLASSQLLTPTSSLITVD